MKNAFKIALPTVLAIVLAYVVIEAIKYGRAKWQAEQDARSYRAQQVAAAAAAAEPVEE